MTKLALTTFFLFASPYVTQTTMAFDGELDWMDSDLDLDDGARALRRGGGGRGGKGRGRAPDGIDFVNITCPALSAEQPECTVGRRNSEAGAWVCRTLVDEETGDSATFSACIDTERSIGNNDTCGCCGDECPVACTCACEITGRYFSAAREGVLILPINGTNADGEETTGEGRCVDANKAARITTGPGFKRRFVCDESCL